MKHSFDRDIKQKLQGITPEEAGYRPDRDKLWQQIAAKKKPGKRAVPFWLGHAAAVAAGLLLGFFFFYPGSEIRQEHTVATANVAPVIKTIRDTVYMPQPARSVPAPAMATVAPGKGRPATAAPVKAGAPVPVQLPVQEQPPAIGPAPQEPLLAVTKPVPARVLHLSDMDNENARSGPKARNEPVSYFALSYQNQSGPDAETVSTMIAQKLNLVKN